MPAKLLAFPEKAPAPPRRLGKAGLNLWGRVHAEYSITDAGGVELLCTACQALDRAEACREQIDKDGEMVRFKGGVKENPLLRSELQNRALVMRAISKLGLDVQPLQQGKGRPSGYGESAYGD